MKNTYVCNVAGAPEEPLVPAAMDFGQKKDKDKPQLASNQQAASTGDEEPLMLPTMRFDKE